MLFLLPQLQNPNQMKISVAMDEDRKSMFFWRKKLVLHRKKSFSIFPSPAEKQLSSISHCAKTKRKMAQKQLLALRIPGVT
jgi:hypothetical protein